MKIPVLLLTAASRSRLNDHRVVLQAGGRRRLYDVNLIGSILIHEVSMILPYRGGLAPWVRIQTSWVERVRRVLTCAPLFEVRFPLTGLGVVFRDHTVADIRRVAAALGYLFRAAGLLAATPVPGGRITRSSL